MARPLVSTSPSLLSYALAYSCFGKLNGETIGAFGFAHRSLRLGLHLIRTRPQRLHRRIARTSGLLHFQAKGIGFALNRLKENVNILRNSSKTSPKIPQVSNSDPRRPARAARVPR